MADIRINSLPTTASASSSDDFLALDGATNGTRKLNAFSPTFGGNLTVSGTASVTGQINGSAGYQFRGATGVSYELLRYVGGTNNPGVFAAVNESTKKVTIIASGSLVSGQTLGLGAEGSEALTLGAANATLAGNLTVSGTGTSSVAGSLGIGTTSPGTLLDAVGTSSTGLVRVTDYSNGDAGQFIARGSRGTPASPTAQNASDSTGLLRMYGYDGSSFIENARIYAQTAGTIAANRVGGVLSFWTHPDSTSAIAEAMRITQAQNLLLGTTTDTGQKLQVKGGTRITDSASASNYITIGSGNDAPYGNNSVVAQTGTLVMGTVAAASLVLYTNATTALTLDSSQNATFAGNAAISGSLLAGKTTTNLATVGFRVDTDGASYASLNSSVDNTTAYNVYSTSAAAYRFYVGLGGTVFATNTTISAISDARLKENVRDLSGGLSSILALKPRVFDWKEGKGANKKNVRGFIAQEIEQVFPDLVDEWKDAAPEGEAPYKSVRQDLIPVLVKAIQELTARVVALENA